MLRRWLGRYRVALEQPDQSVEWRPAHELPYFDWACGFPIQGGYRFLFFRWLIWVDRRGYGYYLPTIWLDLGWPFELHLNTPPHIRGGRLLISSHPLQVRWDRYEEDL